MPARKSPATAVTERPIEMVPLEKLHFDLRNPRYGMRAGSVSTDRAGLNHIVSTFGVQDVLSSLAVNGFFDTEPLIGLRAKPGDDVKVLEGNRRLAACLILAGDERAADQIGRHDRFVQLHHEKGSKPISPIPVIVYEGPKGLREVLPYLGIRHIAGSLPWDSHAKAAWADHTSRSNDLSLVEISQMIGDDSDTVPRLVEGFRFVNQLKDVGRFAPEQSQRRGRGSNPEYPFSWVYTALGYSPIRRFVGMAEERILSDNPVPDSKLENAETLMVIMFGNKITGIAAAMDDSRQFGELAKAIERPELCAKLKEGRPLRVVVEEGRPPAERISEGLIRATDILETVAGLIVPGAITSGEAMKLHQIGKEKTVPTARKVTKDLGSLALGETNGDTEE